MVTAVGVNEVPEYWASELQKTSNVNLITHRTAPPIPIMAENSLRLPKILTLTEDETITDYAKWQSNLKFHLRSSYNNNNRNNNNNDIRRSSSQYASASDRQPPRGVTQTSTKSCSLCKAAGRSYQGHDISKCWLLSKFEKLEIAKALRVAMTSEDADFADLEGVDVHNCSAGNCDNHAL